MAKIVHLCEKQHIKPFVSEPFITAFLLDMALNHNLEIKHSYMQLKLHISNTTKSYLCLLRFHCTKLVYTVEQHNPSYINQAATKENYNITTRLHSCFILGMAKQTYHLVWVSVLLCLWNGKIMQTERKDFKSRKPVCFFLCLSSLLWFHLTLQFYIRDSIRGYYHWSLFSFPHVIFTAHSRVWYSFTLIFVKCFKIHRCKEPCKFRELLLIMKLLPL